MIPESSGEYRVALGEYLLDLPEVERKEFWKFLVMVSGLVQSVDVALSLNGLGGACKTVEELRAKIHAVQPELTSRMRFELATLDEFERFYKDGYSAGDFQHIFLDTYMTVRFDMMWYGIGEREEV
jgi:hypothetical protein